MNRLLSLVEKDTVCAQLGEMLREGRGPAAVFGCPEGLRLPLAAALGAQGTTLLVADTETEALRLFSAVKTYRPDAQLYLPRDLPLVDMHSASTDRNAGRLSVLSRLVLGQDVFAVVAAEAFLEKLAPPEAFIAEVRQVSRGDRLEPRALLELLISNGYERVSLLEGPGQCALRGDILDVYPSQSSLPCRIEFFDDEVDQLRCFDLDTQRSVEQIAGITLPPAYETPQTKEGMQRALKKLKDAAGFDRQREDWEAGRPSPGAEVRLPLFFEEECTLADYLPEKTRFFLTEPSRIFDQLHIGYVSRMESVTAVLERGEGHSCQKKLWREDTGLEDILANRYSAVFYALFRTSRRIEHPVSVKFENANASAYLGDLRELERDIKAGRERGDAFLLYAGEQADRLSEQLADDALPCTRMDQLSLSPVKGSVFVLRQTLPKGFVLPGQGLTVLCQEELFGKAQSRVKHKRSGLKFSELSVGDLVVHEAHGIGRFVGVEQLTVQNTTRDYLLLVYKGGDKLYIPTDQLDRIQKYMGAGEDTVPQLSKLGGNEWQNRVSKARSAAKKLAVDLVELYAKRTAEPGFAFSPDSEWQKKLESAFPYEETPDQLSCIEEIKKDMESPRPMDRLLCGDVGYGKTEVALRAAFKAVQDSKQAAFLVPTTILAEQHYATLSARFDEFPVRVACLSRFRKPKERNEIKKKLAAGEIDVIVGTHALLAKDVQFRDLGLLVIDEEHRFGVNHKEKIKAMRSKVDVLTMTATPIPRTLNMAVTGVRDVSTIETPPENRFPVETYVMEYSDTLLQAALRRELGRGGQAFVVSNRVMGMEAQLEKLQSLVPEARMAMANGQMPEQQLEDAMMAFLEKRTDVLLCSTIIESGVDVPNCNTLIVLEADRLGLAQLYQLRGRVGRSTRLAYAYFTVRSGSVMSEDAQKRLLAIKEFTQFGAGYRLAMRDLEIRGAGSLLGAEQHGHITDIGYEYYCKLIRSAVMETKGEQTHEAAETAVEAAVDAFIPKDYAGNELLRMSMYKRIAEITCRAEYEDLYDEFTDRCGTLPDTVENLMKISLIKALGKKAGLSEISIRQGLVKMKFAPEAEPDGESLLRLLVSLEGTSLGAGEVPVLQWKRKDKTPDDFLKLLPEFLSDLARCNTAQEAL